MEGFADWLRGYQLHNAKDCGKAICEPEWLWQPRTPMRDYDIWYVMDGQGEIEVNGEHYSVSRGTCMLLMPGDIVEARHDPENRLTVVYIHFTMERAEGQLVQEERLPRYVRLEDPQWLEQFLLRLLEVDKWVTRWKDEEFDLLLKLTLLRLIREADQLEQEPPISRMNRQRIQKASDYVRLNMREKLTPQHIGDAFDCSPRYLSRLFKQYLGISLKEYITRVRMERATVLLAETSMTITQIAEAVGYSELFYFSKLFKHVYGVSPLYYRFKGVLSEKHPNPTQQLDR
ncbi:helix-turn-helix transcriptional regulator [Paenibacillus mendelii]|uniref:AraC family transcriptional regulator n=1 Tax=Paenibacillus mendelii TaxID=206163 RepID=A0ABV6JH49_9BACL|nr:AraC family transcriptional regulator [Paenibacillus mendelii]MCQ6557657.1 AraC family transcriptional regulator [Paenibacillus mendelii]